MFINRVHLFAIFQFSSNESFVRFDRRLTIRKPRRIARSPAARDRQSSAVRSLVELTTTLFGKRPFLIYPPIGPFEPPAHCCLLNTVENVTFRIKCLLLWTPFKRIRAMSSNRKICSFSVACKPLADRAERLSCSFTVDRTTRSHCDSSR